MVLQSLKNLNNIFAHIGQENKETLYEHTWLVDEYFNKLIEAHNLKPAIEKLINGIVLNFPDSEKDKTKEFIKFFFYNIPVFHDIGKINPNFQKNKMKNEDFNNIKLSIGSDHSKIGAFLFIQYFLQDIDKKISNNFGNEKIFLFFVLYAFSFVIVKHHSPFFEFENEWIFYNEFLEDFIKITDNYKSLFHFQLPNELLKKIVDQFNKKILNRNNINIDYDYFSLFALLKLAFSLLTAADYYATTHFMQNWNEIESDFGVLDDKLTNKIIKNIKESTFYNKKIYKEIDNYKLQFPEECSNENLNILRQNLAVEVIKNIRENSDKNLFYIEAPTGGGKTNLSLLAVAELINNLKDSTVSLSKVFYVFPFTTLITQTFATIKNTFGLTDNELAQIHSKSGFFQKEDDEYGKKRLNIIDYQFVNYPVVLLSHVRFFDILKSNTKSINYLLHRLANSIVVIDELQAYSPKQWDKIIYFINNYAKYFNIKFILMSATLPKIDKLLLESKDDFVYLIKDKSRYFNNPNFKNRVKFDFELVEELKNRENNDFFDDLFKKIINESEKYAKDNGRVHTIVEFITKKTASAFFLHIKNSATEFFDEIFILSGTILEPRRREIILKLKNGSYSSKKVLLITTQVVEAGVDIDMDIGFKDISLIDSDEQLAGRINRNVNKKNCKLFLFDYDDVKKIYRDDDRLDKLSEDEYKDILENKNFDLIYDKVIGYREKINSQKLFADNLASYIDNIKNLNFSEVNNNLVLINNQKDVSVFVPVKIPVEIKEIGLKNFAAQEIEFLQQHAGLAENTFVDGEKVWECYCNIIEDKEDDFVFKKVNRIMMQSIMSKFCFSISVFSNQMQQLINSGNCEEQYGFFKLNNVDDIYSYEYGIKKLEFEDIFCW